MKYSITATTVFAVLAGNVYTVTSDEDEFVPLRGALLAGDEEAALVIVSKADVVVAWSEGLFEFDGTVLTYDGGEVDAAFASTLIGLVEAGESPAPFVKFYENLQQNPSFRSVSQLYRFLQETGKYPITADGCFIAYKGVRPDYKDHHTCTIDNSVGSEVEYDRNKISDDPNEPCHEGLHAGAWGYASTFGGGPTMAVKVNPRDVVCVPYDSSHQKMRICAYTVVAEVTEESEVAVWVERMVGPEPEYSWNDHCLNFPLGYAAFIVDSWRWRSHPNGNGYFETLGSRPVDTAYVEVADAFEVIPEEYHAAARRAFAEAGILGGE